jgi:hypothetical protein
MTKYLPISLATSLRLDSIANNLKIVKKWSNTTSEQDVIDACLDKVKTLVNGITPRGEIFAEKVAKSQQVQFEEVHDEKDISLLEDIYLKGKGEFGFARLRDEIKSPNVDALLFQRINAKNKDHDRWVAVLNMTQTKDRAYWNKFHELAHRLAEPPQQILPFRRQLANDYDPVEKLMDSIAGNLAFHPRIFLPHFQGTSESNSYFQLGRTDSRSVCTFC